MGKVPKNMTPSGGDQPQLSAGGAFGQRSSSMSSLQNPNLIAYQGIQPQAAQDQAAGGNWTVSHPMHQTQSVTRLQDHKNKKIIAMTKKLTPQGLETAVFNNQGLRSALSRANTGLDGDKPLISSNSGDPVGTTKQKLHIKLNYSKKQIINTSNVSNTPQTGTTKANFFSTMPSGPSAMGQKKFSQQMTKTLDKKQLKMLSASHSNTFQPPKKSVTTNMGKKINKLSLLHVKKLDSEIHGNSITDNNIHESSDYYRTTKTPHQDIEDGTSQNVPVSQVNYHSLSPARGKANGSASAASLSVKVPKSGYIIKNSGSLQKAHVPSAKMRDVSKEKKKSYASFNSSKSKFSQGKNSMTKPPTKKQTYLPFQQYNPNIHHSSKNMKSSSHSALGMIQQKMTGGPLNLKSSIISSSTNKSGKINDEGYATSDRQAKFRKP